MIWDIAIPAREAAVRKIVLSHIVILTPLARTVIFPASERYGQALRWGVSVRRYPSGKGLSPEKGALVEPMNLFQGRAAASLQFSPLTKQDKKESAEYPCPDLP